MSEALPVVAFGSTGGTITMTPDTSGGVVPTLTAADLAASVPGLAEAVELRVETLATFPSASFDIMQQWGVIEWAREQAAQGAAGIVVAQGTDTIEETSFLYDLYWDQDAPFIVTGAMRAPSQIAADGPANLLAACRAAASPLLRGQGVQVVLDNTINAARYVRKTNSWSLHTFSSPDYGPVGYVVEGRVRGHRIGRSPVRLGAPQRKPWVPILETHAGDEGQALHAVVAAGADGVVVGAFGVAHVSYAMSDAIAELSSRLPIVVASRTGSGGTLRHTYGYVGAEIDLQEKGVILSGELDPRKARALLWGALAEGRQAADLPDLFGAFDF